MTIRINVTKAVLVKSAMCGGNKSTNCAIAVAVRDLFPDARIGYWTCNLTGIDGASQNVPLLAQKFISKFDKATPEQRILMPEFSFEIEVPSSVIDKIGISEAYRILSESKTLELVHA